ncbi:MAG: S-adenosylmethionine:tRNA ribosyltransferase-isomerase [Flavobacteriales bacterium]|nr:S-adenosylmethionine:tRNA ribosyltransferase-isomerase [Flavobacteriales bacterium]
MDPKDLRITDHTYHLPYERIATRPPAERDSARLLVCGPDGLKDRWFNELAQELPAGTLLVLNDTRVIHARIRFRRATGAVIECMVLCPEGDRPLEEALNEPAGTRWWCMLGNTKRWKGEELVLEPEGRRFAMRKLDERNGEFLIEFRWEGGKPFLDQLDRFGAVPLPPYMRREAMPDDEERYNTVFGVHPGSVAAPTASLHLTPELLQAMAQGGISTVPVTLHVGAGTFLPVKGNTMREHAMHREQVRISRGTVEALLRQLGKGPIVPVGTTAMRTMESLYWFGADLAAGTSMGGMQVDQWRPYAAKAPVETNTALEEVLHWLDQRGADHVAGTTALLIAPGYRFRLADGLVTNFHQPHSTLLLLVAAFIGPRWKQVYAHALDHGYRFLSYGDGSLLWK